MSLTEKLMEDMKAAMKEKEAGKEKLTVIRMARAAIKNVEIDQKKELDDQEIIQVLSKQVKQCRDAIPEYEQAGRSDIVAKLEEEIKILQVYLPQQLTEAELKEIVAETIEETGASGLAQMGKVMSAVMPKVTGRADGKLVNKLTKELLS